MNTYVLLGGMAVVLSAGGFVTGCSYQQSKAEKVIRSLEHQYQDSANKINGEKNAQIKAINNQLSTTIISLRNASRADKASDGQTSKLCDGSQLFREDGEFLARESARADEIRVSLLACYAQYEAIQ
jgi:hypothetical protein